MPKTYDVQYVDSTEHMCGAVDSTENMCCKEEIT